MMTDEMRSERANLSLKGWRAWKNRGPLDIIDLVLVMCQAGALKTRIMYKCNLNSKQIKIYLDFLLERKLLTKEIDPRLGSRFVYLSTQKGRKYIDAYNTMLRLLAIDPETHNV
ncbi:MAG: hypothetical protein JRN52_13935 [Nitrososphaerota archaeon]|nr:hypothetical protein [Nitrososphaerota archaeon]